MQTLKRFTQSCRRFRPNRKVNPARHYQTAHHSAHKGGSCNNRMDCFPSSSLLSRFRTNRLPFFDPLKDILLRRQAETQCAWRSPTLQQRVLRDWHRASLANIENCVDKKNQLDVTFCIIYYSSNSCSTCFGQPCAHHQELTTAWCCSLVLVCAVAAGRLSSPVGR